MSQDIVTRQGADLFLAQVMHHAQIERDPFAGAHRYQPITNAKSAYFPIFAQMVTTQKNARALQTPDNAKSTRVQISITDYIVQDLSDEQEVMKIPFEERDVLAQSIAKAIIRRKTQTLIDALAAGNGFGSGFAVANSVGPAAGMNTAKARRAKKIMDAANIPAEDRYAVVHPSAIEQMLYYTEVGSQDYNPVRALRDGELNRWLGFTWIVIGDMKEGGIPLSGGDRLNFFYHKSYLAYVDHPGVRMADTERSPDHDAWWIRGRISCGAGAIEDDGTVTGDTNFGIVRVNSDDDAADPS